MRVISLTDGRVCYLAPARPKIALPPGETLALASLAGGSRFAVQVPDRWAAMNESDLRRLVEGVLQERPSAPRTDAPIPSAPAKRSRWSVGR